MDLRKGNIKYKAFMRRSILKDKVFRRRNKGMIRLL